MDPIYEEELKKSSRAQQYQQYQNYVDSLDNPGKKDSAETSKIPEIGEMKGRTVKVISEKDSSIEEVFNRYSNKDSKTPEPLK